MTKNMKVTPFAEGSLLLSIQSPVCGGYRVHYSGDLLILGNI